jgi:hypothetical protein
VRKRKYLNGRNPDITIWKGKDRYQAIGGISLGKFFVLHGASNAPADLLPAMPPIIFRGNPTATKLTSQKQIFLPKVINKMTKTIVPAGTAAVTL